MSERTTVEQVVDRWDYSSNAGLLEALGIDPDMDVDTLRRRLLLGERVEQCEVSEWEEAEWPNIRLMYTPCPTPPGGWSGKEWAVELHEWLTRPAEGDDA